MKCGGSGTVASIALIHTRIHTKSLIPSEGGSIRVGLKDCCARAGLLGYVIKYTVHAFVVLTYLKWDRLTIERFIGEMI